MEQIFFAVLTSCGLASVIYVGVSFSRIADRIDNSEEERYD